VKSLYSNLKHDVDKNLKTSNTVKVKNKSTSPNQRYERKLTSIFTIYIL